MTETKKDPLYEPVLPERVRTLPKHFAWVDHSLRHRLPGLSLEEIALLFFLHLAADKLGCSYWSDASIAKRLGLQPPVVSEARLGLVRKGLVAYRWPLYQILPLSEEAP
jgi:hypothetical protein